MAYPTNPALNSSQALYPDLWNGLIWAYLPGYNKTTPIVGGDTLGGSTTTTLDTYAEGTGETFDLSEYRVGITTPLNGTTAGTIHAHYRMLWANDGTASGVLGTAASTAWANVGQLVINDAGGTVRGVWKRGGAEALVTGAGAVHNASTNPVVNALTWRDATTVGVHDFLIAEVTASGAGVTGALANTEPVIVGSYYDRSNERSSNIAFFCGAIWNRVLTTVEKNLLASDPFAVFQRGASGPTDGAASGAFPVVTLTSPSATAPGTSSGATNGASSGALPVVSTSTPSATATGTTAGSGTVSIPPITDFGTRTVLKNVPNISADFYNISTKALVVSVTGLTSHASTGAVSAVSTSLVAGTTYRTVVEFTYGGHTYRGVWNLVAS